MTDSVEKSVAAETANLLAGVPAGTIVRREDYERIKYSVSLLERVQSLTDQAEKTLLAAEENAASLLDKELKRQKRAMAKKLRDSFLKEQIRAQEFAVATIEDLKPQIAATVTRVVQKLLGEIPDEDRVLKLTTEAIRRADDVRDAKVMCASDVFPQIEKAAEKLQGDGGEEIQVICDPSLEAGRAILTTRHGHVEIGEKAILQNAANAWGGMTLEAALK